MPDKVKRTETRMPKGTGHWDCAACGDPIEPKMDYRLARPQEYTDLITHEYRDGTLKHFHARCEPKNVDLVSE